MSVKATSFAKVSGNTPKSAFPVLARSTDSSCKGLIIFFTEETTGIVVAPGNSEYSIMHYSTEWVNVYDGPKEWEILSAGDTVTINLTQE